ncbi:6-bladed beta-propeller [Aliifodinibius sp. S!AR15-10]|uniref:6-bladed beta-propeller n=1 Tax=Aliifodinibius sp. S!AR15-10 TaxID=2950437 RepID=UPI00286024A1|nr:6-bladed beta-propeller [Aliifodinibius sp. S!AR15-10]MDR8393856.1 6-bladed beta-propeller [Aliifodinibius sp. S!AR15-10]
MNRLFVAFVSLFLASCSGEHGRVQEDIPDHVHETENLTIFPLDTEPVYDIELLPEQTFGDTGEPYLRNVMDSRVDDKGRVLIKELISINEQPLHVYNPDGSYRTQVGRIGRGPGEYGMVSTFSVSADKLFVYDQSNRRLNIYDSETYTFEGTVKLEDWSVWNHEAEQNMRLFRFYTRDDGNLIAHFYNGLNPTADSVRQTFMLVNSDGDVLNPELLEIPDGYSIMRGGQRMRLVVPSVIGGSSIFALSGDGTMYAAGPDGFLIKKFDDQGRYQSAFYYPVKAPPHDYESSFGGGGTSANAPSSIRQQPSHTGEIEVPDTNPVFVEMRADDENRIWVRVRTEDQVTEWWVLDHSGKLLARFHWPRRIYEIQNGYLYSGFSGFGEEAGKVIRYRIELTER